MSQLFTIKIHCKRYVKAYIYNNCGSPADIREIPDLYDELILCLQNIYRNYRDCRIGQWQDTMEIIIPSDIFYRYGWEVNKVNEFAFNKLAEHKIKFLMYQYVSLNVALGMTKTFAIKEFQKQFKFDEDIWSFESIKKDYDRNGALVKINLLKNLREEMLNIFLVNLSEFGTISKKLKKEYCNG